MHVKTRRCDITVVVERISNLIGYYCREIACVIFNLPEAVTISRGIYDCTAYGDIILIRRTCIPNDYPLRKGPG